MVANDVLRVVGAFVLVAVGLTLAVGGVYEFALAALAGAGWLFLSWYRSMR